MGVAVISLVAAHWWWMSDCSLLRCNVELDRHYFRFDEVQRFLGGVGFSVSYISYMSYIGGMITRTGRSMTVKVLVGCSEVGLEC